MTAPTPIRLLVVEDQTIFRDVLVEWLGTRGFVVVAAVGSVAEAEQVLASHAIDVMLLDVGLPGENGLALLERASTDNPRHVVLVTAQESVWVVDQARTSRAKAVVMKGAPLSDLGTAIDRVIAGTTFHCRRTSALLRRSVRTHGALESLTAREREILALVASGASSPRIAAQLGIRVKTVQNHRANLMEKLEIRDVASLTRFAIAQGLVSAGDSFTDARSD